MARGQFIDLTGQRFGRLTVVKRADFNYNMSSALWVCKCDCGNVKNVVSTSLRYGRTRSCGCLATETKAARAVIASKAAVEARKSTANVPEERPKNRDIHPDGYAQLIEGIVQQAKKDMMASSPGTEMWKDVKNFFLSDYFRELMDLDGEVLYRQLLKEYYKKRSV